MASQLVQLPSGHKVELCLRSNNPNENTTDAAAQLAVLLHPWSWLGGNMNDPVIQLLERHLLDRGYYVLRYNSRGVGRSKGWPSLSGAQEAQDLREIVQWAIRERVPNVRHLLLVGYSHGSLITSQHPPLSSSSSSSGDPLLNMKTSHILLSYPLGPRAWLTLFRSKAYAAALSSLVRNPDSRVLLVYGDQDEFTGIGSYQEWAEELKKQGEEGVESVENTFQSGEERRREGRVSVCCIEGGGHFWAQDQGKVEEMLDVVERWLDGDRRG